MYRPFESHVSPKACFLFLGLIALTAGCAQKSAGLRKIQKQAAPLVTRGDAAYSRMDFEKSLQAYVKAEALGYQDGVVSYRIDILRSLLGKTPAGRPIYRNRTRLLLEELLRSRRAGPTAYFYLAQVLGASRGDRLKARLYAEALKRFDNDSLPDLPGEDYEKLGRMYAYFNLPAKAEKLLKKARARDERHALAAFHLGRLYYRTGRFEEAAQQLEAYTKMVPRDAEGKTILGDSYYERADYARSVKAYRDALALDVTNGRARSGLRRAQRAIRRIRLLRESAKQLKWGTAFSSRLVSLTLSDDALYLKSGRLGPAAVGPEGKVLAIASGAEERRNIYTLSSEGLNLRWRAKSSSGFTGVFGNPRRLMISQAAGPRQVWGGFDDTRGTVEPFYQGECRQAHFSPRSRSVVCMGPQGILLVNPATGKSRYVSKEIGARHPRLGPEGQRIIYAVKDNLVWINLEGKILGRLKMPGGEASASHPDISPDGRWVISGAAGLYLTSLKEKTTVPLRHPRLRGAGRAVFDPSGRSLVLVLGGTLARLTLPEEIERFYAFRRAVASLEEGRFAEAFRSLKRRPAADRGSAEYHFLLGRALMGLRLPEKADKAFRRAAKLSPRDWRPYLYLGRIQAEKKNWGAAERILGHAIGLAPGEFRAYLYRAQSRAMQGRFDEAAKDYRRAQARLDRKNPGFRPEEDAILLGLLAVYVQMARMDDALILLLEEGDRLSAAARARLGAAPIFERLRRDSRFGEVFADLKPAARPGKPAKGKLGRVRGTSPEGGPIP